MARSVELLPTFLSKLQAGLHRCGAVEVSMLVAVSGGADSVALLRGLLQLQPALNLTLRAAHLNHQLRGSEAEADAAWVRTLCERFNVVCDIETVPVRELAEQNRRGLEETARDARYAFLRSVAERQHCDVVATAHTADDQAETVLHHILRGTGLTGLRGMEWSRSLDDSTQPPHSMRLIRPMLSIWRADVELFLAELGQDFRQDATNQDVSLTRNRLRHELLPHLEHEFNPRVREHLCQLAEQAAECDAALRIAADTLLKNVLLDQSENIVRLRCDELAKAARPLVREVFVRVWQHQDWLRLAMTFSHWDRLADLVRSDPPAAIHLPGRVLATRRANMLVLESQT
ncbi:MAG: tRNA lysidine(34) synthetase TilS [Planctomycetaceae bacterium]|nr:tRNA lysidine(34) synthetase TilS [Planctomycetaceae bacterium]